ncbi:MAG TPA: Lrp/AsnC family transcriptional regulator [Thermoprotei archaeon]|nr:Lrp/AsnC family transcriptional regulator [Thermoprotei archaeon]
MKAIMLIIVEPNMMDEVCKKLIKIPEIKKVYEITGEFDIFIELEFDSIDTFRNILRDQVMKIEGVRMTQSSVVMSEWK